MGLRDFLDIPRKWKHPRARSEEANSVKATQIGLTASTHSQPDSRIDESSISLTPAPSTSQNREPSGTCTSVFRRTYLTIFPCKLDNAAHDPTQSATGTEHDKQQEPSEHTVNPSAMDENESNRESTPYSATKLVTNLVEESADAFPPLKSVVGSLSAIVDHCDVRFIFLVAPLGVLIAVLANGGVSQNDRIVDASS